MNFIGNIIWVIFGGFFSAIGYVIGGLILCATIFGIPFGLQCFKIAAFVLFPFGKRAINRPTSNGCLSLFANIIWFICGGWYTALNHLFWAVLLAISVIGLPFAKQHLKLMEVSLFPFGKRVISE